jgi:nucleoside-diphosphate-sugar epimerase
MNVLVTGATGRIGSRFVPRLLLLLRHPQRYDRSVKVLARNPESAEFLRQKGAQIIMGDLLEPSSWAPALRGVDAVVHLAAFFRGASPEQTEQVIVKGTELLAQEAVRAGVRRFVYASTNTVYGPGLNRPFREEDTPRAPDTAYYPASKVRAEALLLNLQRGAMGLCILRLPFVYGEGDPHLSELPRFIKTWNPAKRMHMAHHADVGQALLRALYTPGIERAIYNIADDAPITAQELVQLLALPDLPEVNSSLPYDPWEMIVDTSKARRELGFRPIYPSFYSAMDAGML